MSTAWRGTAGFEFAEGAAFADERRALDARAFFDLASITKSFLAATVARLVERGSLGIRRATS